MKSNKKEVKKNKNKALKKEKTRKTHPRIIITAIAALICVGLALFEHWLFIIPAVILWWINKKEIKKHFGV